MADRQTKQVRIYEDLAGKLGDITDVTDQSIADLLDPIIRTHIEETHEKLAPAIKAIRTARLKHRPATAAQS